LLASVAAAQAPPILSLIDASAFEGNSGTRTLAFNVTLSGPSSGPVTARFSATPLTGTGFVAATGSAACGGSVDFVQQSDVLVTIATGQTSTTVPVTMCGDGSIETSEHVFVALRNVVGAQCLEGTCDGVGTIRNDDGPPSITINDISSSEPFTGTRTASFTLSLSHPSPPNVSANISTTNGTAVGASSCAPFTTGGKPDFVNRSGSVPIPENALTASVGVTICGDGVKESNQTYFVNLLSASGATIADSRGQGTIRDAALIVGSFDLSPESGVVASGEEREFEVTWTMPDGLVWRTLNTIDLRIRSEARTALWIRWEEPGNTFSLCETVNAGPGHRPGPDGDIVCGPGALPGGAVVLETEFAQVGLAGTTVKGSGPTGPSVTLRLPIVLRDAAAHRYWMELAATDDLGNADEFVEAGTVHVMPTVSARP
jgi:hypothetical protein